MKRHELTGRDKAEVDLFEEVLGLHKKRRKDPFSPFWRTYAGLPVLKLGEGPLCCLTMKENLAMANDKHRDPWEQSKSLVLDEKKNQIIIRGQGKADQTGEPIIFCPWCGEETPI